MRTKEPEFMQQLHKIRERLSKRWSKMSDEAFLKSFHDSKKWFKDEMKSLRFKKAH